MGKGNGRKRREGEIMGFHYTIYPHEISKSEFYSRGAFSNPKLFRKMIGSAWKYFSY